MHQDPSEFSYNEGEKETEGAVFYSRPVEDRRVAGRSLVGSEVPRELALFTAVEGGVVEEGAGGAVPLRPLVLLLVCGGLHNLTAQV